MWFVSVTRVHSKSQDCRIVIFRVVEDEAHHRYNRVTYCDTRRRIYIKHKLAPDLWLTFPDFSLTSLV